MAIIVIKKDGTEISHSNATEAEGVNGELFLRGERNQTVANYGNGEWDSWTRVEKAE